MPEYKILVKKENVVKVLSGILTLHSRRKLIIIIIKGGVNRQILIGINTVIVPVTVNNTKFLKSIIEVGVNRT